MVLGGNGLNRNGINFFPRESVTVNAGVGVAWEKILKINFFRTSTSHEKLVFVNCFP